MTALTHAAAAGRRTGEVLPQEAYVAALMALPALWPARLAALLGIGRAAGREARTGVAVDARRSAEAAWAVVRRGRAAELPAVRSLLTEADPDAVAAHWAAAAMRVDVGALWATYRRLGVRVDVVGDPGYPPQLAGEGGAPYVVFRSGANPDLAGRTVAVVGTRRCTPAGREIAAELAAGLASAGVRVVSGLALGIDGAAHQAALDAGGASPIGVVAGGFDRPYPARHRMLWQQVACVGTLVSEWPLGTRSEGWRFPARNRLIVALSEVVVVVESHAAGGSMLTAEQAMERGVPVLAVPGSIRSGAAIGTNRLLRDGAAPACGVEDVLTALSLEAGVGRRADQRATPSPAAAAVLASMGWDPVSTDRLAARTRLEPASLAVLLAHLELDGWIAGGAGWWQRIGPGDAADERVVSGEP
jgi:DNA processing protein